MDYSDLPEMGLDHGFKIVCPHCQYDGTTDPEHGYQDADERPLRREGDGREPWEDASGFLLLEDVTIIRQLRPWRSDKESLVANAWYRTGDGYDDGIQGTMRIECRNCMGEFKLPTTDIDYR